MAREILFTEEEIQARVGEIAKVLNEKFKDKDPLIIGLLVGSFMFCSDLLKKLDFSFQFEFIRTSAYGTNTEALDDVIMERNPISVWNRDVIIIDDILDSGKTMEALSNKYLEEGAKSITLVVMFNKQARRVRDIKADIIGFEVEDRFLAGYGMNDTENRGRHLPYVYAISED